LLQALDEFGDFLSAVFVGDEKCVRYVEDDEIFDADLRYDRLFRMQVAIGRILEHRVALNVVAVVVSWCSRPRPTSSGNIAAAFVLSIIA
jgi:hypothetical protein